MLRVEAAVHACENKKIHQRAVITCGCNQAMSIRGALELRSSCVLAGFTSSRRSPPFDVSRGKSLVEKLKQRAEKRIEREREREQERECVCVRERKRE